MNTHPAEVAEIIAEMDTDGSGSINFTTFVNMMQNGRYVDREQELVDAFKIFDRNHDGHISATELQYIMSTLGEKLSDEDLVDMVREADTDGGRSNQLFEILKGYARGSMSRAPLPVMVWAGGSCTAPCPSGTLHIVGHTPIFCRMLQAG